MSSTATPLKRQRSVKFTRADSTSKPSIKITVSSDALAETLLKTNVVIPSSNMEDSDEENCGQQQSPSQQQPALIQIVGNCCNSNGGGVDNSSESGVLCNCANGGNEKRTRIALDDFTVLEFPNCIDFGIKDFLCCKDEIELDLSSDTDASFLDATPPHRFSDSELENQIEAMSITLDTQLNPFSSPQSGEFIIGNEDEDEEETTEESFIMDEEEASSSASNSAATICGDFGGNNLADLEEHEEDENDFPSRDLLIQGEVDVEVVAKQHESINSVNESLEEAMESITDNSIRLKSISQEQLRQNDLGTKSAAVSASQSQQKLFDSQGKNSSRKMVNKHPTKQFRRQISLPASIFMTYLLEQNNKANYCNHHLRQQQQQQQQHNNCEIIAKNKLNRSNSCKQQRSVTKSSGKGGGGGGIVIELQPPLQPLTPSKKRMGSFRTSKVIHGSIEDYEEDDIHNSNSFSDTNEDYLAGGDGDDRLSSCEESNSKSKWKSAWDSKSDSFTTNPDETSTDGEDPQELEFDDEQQAFTSEVEKRSLILRHVRRLIRQDTATGNFAPPDFSI